MKQGIRLKWASRASCEFPPTQARTRFGSRGVAAQEYLLEDPGDDTTVGGHNDPVRVSQQ